VGEKSKIIAGVAQQKGRERKEKVKRVFGFFNENFRLVWKYKIGVRKYQLPK
jgi:acetyl-CoA carboxylase alpha subunit